MSTQQHGLSEEDLARLGPEERAALEADLSDDEKKLADGAEGVIEDDAEATAKAAAEKAAADKAAADKAAAEKAAAEASGTTAQPPPDAPPAEESPFVVPYQARATDPAKVDAELKKLQEQYDAGELTLADMLTKRDAINRAVIKDELSVEHADQTREALWFNEVDRFVESNPGYKNATLYRALDAEIKAIAAEKDKEGKLVHAGLSDRQLLTLAHDNLVKAGAAGAAKPAAATDADKIKAKAAERAPDTSSVPTTLAHTPPAAPGDEGGEFSSIDKLIASGDSAAAELAIAKMSKEQQERYLQGA